MADLFAVAGSKVYIGGVMSTQATDFVAGDFASQSWVQIDGWVSCGAIGDTAEEIATALINRNRTVKQKGTRDAGSWENTFAGLEGGDAGQSALFAAEGTTDNYAFKVEWSSGEVWRFVGLVMSKGKAGGEANTVDNRTVTIAINSNIVES